MARRTIAEAEAISTEGGRPFKWFSLKNDGETKKVRILAKSVDDLLAFSLHPVMIDGRKKYINCLREDYTSPLKDCPFCESGNKPQTRIFLKLLDIQTGEVYIWDRSSKIINKLRSLERRLNGADLVDAVVEIERNGKPNSTNTTYELYIVDINKDANALEKGNLSNLESYLFVDAPYEEVKKYLETGDEGSLFQKNQVSEKKDSFEERVDNASNDDITQVRRRIY